MTVSTLEQAIAKMSRLSDADQEEIGRKLLSHLERLNALRAELDKGIRSLMPAKAGAGTWRPSSVGRMRDMAEHEPPVSPYRAVLPPRHDGQNTSAIQKFGEMSSLVAKIYLFPKYRTREIKKPSRAR